MTLEEKTSPNLENYPKARDEFEQWYDSKSDYRFAIATFNNLPFDFQSGVYLAFLREKGLIVWACPVSGLVNDKRAWAWCIFTHEIGTGFDNPTTALIAAIEAGFHRLETPSA